MTFFIHQAPDTFVKFCIFWTYIKKILYLITFDAWQRR